MKVFLSWSGDRSRRVAEALRDWLPGVLQAVEPWLSSKDAAPGRRWSSSLAKALEEARIGIVCLTKENIREEWLQFEAGALSRLSDDALLCLYALDVEAKKIDGPLSQYQVIRADRDGTFSLLVALNQSDHGPKLPDKQLERAFDLWWPEMAKPLSAIPAVSADAGASLDDRLARAIELLETLVGLQPPGKPAQHTSTPGSAAGKPIAKRPRAFIGCSAEGLTVAHAIQQLLEPVAEATLLWRKEFSLGTSVLERLNDARLIYDFAVFVLTPDDEVTSRGRTAAAPQSTVIFELGFFSGALGRARTFVVLPADSATQLPSDLSGVTTATYRTSGDRDLVAALAPAVSQITRAMGVAGERG